MSNQMVVSWVLTPQDFSHIVAAFFGILIISAVVFIVLHDRE